MSNKKRNIGVISFISLIIGITSIAIYLTGDTLIDDNVTMLSSFIFLIIALIFSLLSRRNIFGRISLYVSAILLGIFVLFFVGISLFWTTP
ncbi:hypothetical protein [Virgibacillus sp. CBA3643]|uniref:hypothetical protein n=1 Tax=Virgibacillus sp. CBA3643 TaxID=2942278 RepID=UPI0035A29A9D